MSDVLVEAEGLLEQLPDAVARRSLGERLGNALQELESAEQRIERIKAVMATAAITGFGKQQLQAQTLKDLVECVDEVGEALEDADDADALRQAVFEYSNELKRAMNSVDLALRTHWQTLAAGQFQPMIGLGDLLTSMNIPSDLGKRLAACGREAVGMQTNQPAVEFQAAVSRLLADYERLQSERAAAIGEDEVGEFINALADKEATLAMVTDKVRAWLVNHDALDRLRITPL